MQPLDHEVLPPENSASATFDYTRILNSLGTEMDGAIRHADLKAQLILGVDAILLAAVANFPLNEFGLILNGSASIAERGVLLLEVLVVGAILLSLIFALMTIMPRIRSGTRGSANLFFFADIVKFKEKDYIERYLTSSDDELKEAILAQVHAKSDIVMTKFEQVRLSLVSLFMAAVGWAAVTVLPIFLG
ncbi:hypothetical protein G4Y79_17210 [Phototrophicus methaneseepsis]|uniref:Pycsar effector protein domain-containing protein n=1 Tax=Phototrophicus methaneseepsis TaxID=2710758 RepID=A0A7S8E6V3_9CHLR|nr:Pycsar system effector family protein [Phototrophicus methaneseepsis]QPC81425.1 hypothetical protein G4Y79_17210 [Phototrophicus methaneseepsis]